MGGGPKKRRHGTVQEITCTVAHKFLLGIWPEWAVSACECASYLGGHNPVITELGRDESLTDRTLPMTNIDSPTVYSSLITTKLEEKAARGRGW